MGRKMQGTRKAATNKAQHTPMLRQLQTTSACAVNIALNTTYNADKDVVPFVGIMFSVFTKTPLDILTIELDIRFGTNNTDLSVEVYSYTGRYELVFDDPVFWTLVANTTLVPAPEGTGAIIPQSDFNAVSTGRNERTSFYITMRNPVLQYNVDALTRTDEIALQTPDMDLLAGIGFNEYKFPDAFDTVVDPQFTGVIHYARQSTCGQVSSTVDYEFILDKQLRGSLLGDLNAIVDAAMIDILQKNSRLQELQKMQGLQKDGDAQTAAFPYNGLCPTEECSLLLRTSVNFIHDDSLRSGELIWLLYQFADSITDAVRQQTSGVNIIYVGPRDVAATYGIILGGVPPGETMDTVQQEYFADVTVDFLSETSDGDRVLDLQIDEQLEDDGSIQLIGKLLGASYRPANAFVNGLESSFREGQEAYIQKLILDRLRPNAINEIGGIEFFEGISSVGGRVDVDRDVTTAVQEDDGGEKSLNLVLVIGSAVSGLVVIIIACWFCQTMRKSRKARKEKKERKLCRQRKKAERQARLEAAKETQEEAEETLLGQDEEHDHARNFKEGITPTSDEDSEDPTSSDDDGRQSTVDEDDADLAHVPEDSKSLQEPKAAPSKSAKSKKEPKAAPRRKDSSADKSAKSKKEPKAAPRSKDTSADKSAKPKKETEDISPRKPSKKPQKKEADELSRCSPSPQRKPQKKEAEELSPRSPSPQRKPQKKEAEEFSSPQKKPQKKEAEEFSSPQKKPQNQSAKSLFAVLPESPRQQAPGNESVKSLFDVLPVSPRKRATPKLSKAMGSNESPRRSPSVPAPEMLEGASPAAPSKFIELDNEEGEGTSPIKSPSKMMSGSRSVQYQLPSYKSGKPEGESSAGLSKFIEDEAKSPSTSSTLGLNSKEVKRSLDVPPPPESPPPESLFTRPKPRVGTKLPDVPAFEGKMPSQNTRVTTEGSGKPDKAPKAPSYAGLSKSCHTGFSSPATSKPNVLDELVDEDEGDDDDDEFGDDDSDEDDDSDSDEDDSDSDEDDGDEFGDDDSDEP